MWRNNAERKRKLHSSNTGSEMSSPWSKIPSSRISDDEWVTFTRERNEETCIPVKKISIMAEYKSIKDKAATRINKLVRGFLIRRRLGKCHKEIQKFNWLYFLLFDEDFRKSISEDSYEQAVIDTKKA